MSNREEPVDPKMPEMAAVDGRPLDEKKSSGRLGKALFKPAIESS